MKYDANDVFDFMLGIISVFNGIILIVNNIIALIENLFDDTDA